MAVCALVGLSNDTKPVAEKVFKKCY